jgi:hypothetical protein
MPPVCIGLLAQTNYLTPADGMIVGTWQRKLFNLRF